MQCLSGCRESELKALNRQTGKASPASLFLSPHRAATQYTLFYPCMAPLNRSSALARAVLTSLEFPMEKGEAPKFKL